ncbi:hypothetical protein JEZ13_06085 [bacterium]|nr:hypothetical protein [bacterium]
MKKLKLIIVCWSFILLMISCKNTKPTENYITEFSSLNGASYILNIDRLCENPEVQSPIDNLHESNYYETSGNISYEVTFSDNGNNLIIEQGYIQAEKTVDEEGCKYFELEEGTFAGGRFIVWINENRFNVELTIYGSGIPIIRSERGVLNLNQ